MLTLRIGKFEGLAPDGDPVVSVALARINPWMLYNDVLCLPWTPKNRTELYSVLHEFGHVQDKKLTIPRENRSGKLVWESELRAWAYAFRCVQPKWHDELMEDAVGHLQSYRGWLFRAEVKQELLTELRKEGLTYE